MSDIYQAYANHFCSGDESDQCRHGLTLFLTWLGWTAFGVAVITAGIMYLGITAYLKARVAAEATRSAAEITEIMRLGR